MVIMSENRKSKIVVYPNPTDDKITVSSDEEIKSVKIYEMDGRLISEYYNAESIDVSMISRGMYMIEVVTSKGHYFEKLLICK